MSCHTYRGSGTLTLQKFGHTVEAIVSDSLGNSKQNGRNYSWSLSRISSRKRPQVETVEGGNPPT